ncbi:MAG: hypothetical protein LBE12_11060 [Planctomycetaceae bacterium]|nr:hypothetical protein [Planctomycetaceae bacterium]
MNTIVLNTPFLDRAKPFYDVIVYPLEPLGSLGLLIYALVTWILLPLLVIGVGGGFIGEGIILCKTHFKRYKSFSSNGMKILQGVLYIFLGILIFIYGIIYVIAPLIEIIIVSQGK